MTQILLKLFYCHRIIALEFQEQGKFKLVIQHLRHATTTTTTQQFKRFLMLQIVRMFFFI